MLMIDSILIRPVVVGAGETFYKPTNILHRVSRNPNSKTRTRVLAVILHPRDAKQLVVPEASVPKE